MLAMVIVHNLPTTFLTKWHMQTVQAQIRLLLQEQSDQGLQCLLLFHKVFFETNA